jgi:hypothetical protein
VSAASKTPATAETLLALGDAPFEVLNGELVRKAEPSAEHSDAQAGLIAIVRPPFHRRAGGPDGPGGWWILTEIDIELAAHDVVRPDLAGWRRERSRSARADAPPPQPTGLYLRDPLVEQCQD